MDPNFNLIKLVDPSKSSSKIKDKFAKLTLSSNKKRQIEAEKPQEQAEDSSTTKSNPSRKLFHDYLTDDDSDNEAEVLNRIFRSKTTTKTSDNGAKEPQKTTSVRRSRSFSQRLQMSDSDETNCSLEQAAYARRIQSEPMERLRVSESQPGERKSSSKLFTSNGITDKSDIPLQQISNRLSSLDIKGSVDVNTMDSSNQRQEDAKLENVLKQHFEMKTELVEETPVKPRYSVLTISSTATSPVSVYDDDSDIVIISESEPEADDDYSYPVSTIRNTAAPSVISETMRDRLDAFFENIPPLASNEGPERIFIHDRTLQASEGRSEQIDESVPEESIEICESSAESGREPAPPELDSSPTKRFLRSAETPTKVDIPSPQQTTTPRRMRTQPDTPEFIQKQATPRKTRTPRTRTPKKADTPLQDSPSRRKLKMDTPTSNKKVGTTKKIASPTPEAIPDSTRTPRKTPTPKVRKKGGSASLAEPDSPPEESSSLPKSRTKSPTPPVPRPSDAASSCSSEYRIEKINISATIKIRLQFNDDVVASVQTSPFTSSASRFPRLTESESAPDTEERVHTPDHFKQRSIREQNTLTFIDITKNSVASQSSTVKESHSTNNNVSANNADTAPNENQKEESETISSPQFPILQLTPSPAKELEPAEPQLANPDDSLAKEASDIQAVLIPQDESTPARSNIEPAAQALQKSSPLDEGLPIEIDDTAQKLLDQLYGDAWKTPALVKSMKKSRQPNELGAKDESMIDFSRFHTNIQTDLESTRLPENIRTTNNLEPDHVFKIPATDRKVDRKKEEIQKKAASERKPARRAKGQLATQRAQVIYDSDLSDDDFNASSDGSWKGDYSSSSSADTDTSSSDNIRYPSTRKKKDKKTKKNKKKDSSKDEVIYLDLSNDIVKVQEVNESPCANKDEAFQKRLDEFLNTFKCPDKKKIEPTPKNNKIKRKLFTPRFGEEDEASPVPSVRGEFKPIENDVVTLTAPLPPMFEPINKHLESVKTGKPIFTLNTPKTPKSISKKNKENLPSKSGTPYGTPKIANRTPSRKWEKFDSGLLSTPCDRYGFLQSLDVNVAKTFCHPEALIYRENYKSKKQELAEKLYSIYNANIFNNELDVALVWNKKLLNTAGRCSCSTKLGKRMCRIELSEKVLTSADRLRCTLIHELCHAATWIYSGEHGHGATWKKWARRANETFPELPKIQVCHDYDIDYKYTYKCTMCNAKSHAHSKSKKVENIRCAFCHGAIEVFLNKKDKDGNVLPTPVREPTGFAKFVKDNYKKHKRPDLKHADVMKLLSNEFALLNVDGKK